LIVHVIVGKLICLKSLVLPQLYFRITSN